MRKVFTNANDVIHLFAQQDQNNARCSNVFFEGTKIYSFGYHYLLGEFLDSNTILINDEGYSVTTSKHINIARYATSQHKQFYKTKTNLQIVFNSIKKNKNKLANARKPEIYINNIKSLYSTLIEYYTYKKQLTKLKSTKEFRYIKKVVDNLENFTDYKEKLKVIQKAIKAKQQKEIKRKLAKFYKYEINSVRVGHKDFLRVSKDGENVETTQGIKVSVSDAKKLYYMIKNNIDIKGYKIGYYTVNSINGTLKIGCHNIDINSVHKVGKQIIKL
jgi:hypothetical protein